MRGGASNDIYLVADVLYVVIETAGEVINRINTLFDYTNSDNVESLVGNDAIDGSAGADALFGNSGGDMLNGGACDDNIICSFGLGRMLGGVGRDALRVGANAYTFVHGTGDGRDVIVDCSAEDFLDL